MDLKVSVAQFEPKDGDKLYNLERIEYLVARAKESGAQVISFHELCVTAYTFLKDLDRESLDALAEEVPAGESCLALIDLAAKYDIIILAGLVEKDQGRYYNTYVCVDQNGLIAKYRKLHPFISKYMNAGDQYVLFDLHGWKCSILICYDNNVIENVRAVTLMGAELIFAPHVTCCTPSAMPGRGYVDDHYWQQRNEAPEALRKEFDGPKGKGWLMRWLPARAYDNGVYYAYSNPIGYDGEHLKNGNSMVLDPFGEIVAEVRSFEDEIAVTTITKDKLTQAGGYRYRMARRPELYGEILGKSHESSTKPIWLKD